MTASVPSRRTHHATGDRPVVVVGAGLAGLAAAARLQQLGLGVLVLERGAPGGRARTTDRDGYLLNLGPHGLAMGGPGTSLLRDLGIALPGRAPALTATRFFVDGRAVHPLDRRGGAGRGLLPALGRLTRLARRGDPDGSVADVLDEVTDDGRVRPVLDAFARLITYADGFDEQAADVLTEQVRGGSVRYLDGGWGSLVARLRDRVVAGGGQVRTGAAVRRVEHAAGGSPVVHLADGDAVPASAVILAPGGPGHVADLLEGDAQATVARWADRSTPVRLAVLDVALRTRPDVPAIVLGVDEPTYLSVHSDRARLAPSGGAVVHLARFLPLDASAPDGTRALLERQLEDLAPGWRDELVQARFLPDLVLTHDGGRLQAGGRRGRPGPAIPDTPGLFVAGDWVGPRGHLAQATLASAGDAAELAAAYVGGRAPSQGREAAAVGIR
jgi:phytoene dehydrogenase-like protein